MAVQLHLTASWMCTAQYTWSDDHIAAPQCAGIGGRKKERKNESALHKKELSGGGGGGGETKNAN